jgi:hypothetical protein
MKKLAVLFLLLAVGLLPVQCQTKKSTDKSTSKRQRASNKLVIDFISKGSGIDNDTYSKIEAFANNHPKKPAFTVEGQGKEGEKKMAFTLTELTEDEQYAFVDEVRKLVPDASQVKVNSKLPKKKQFKATNGADPAGGPVTYRLVVSFISKGAGIDYKTAESLKSYIENHPKKPAYEVKSYGREGETDYVLTLKELNADEQKLFVDQVKKLVSSSDMTLVKENEPYTKKGR